MPDSQIYSFFLDTPSAPFLFRVKLNIDFRPNVGDSLTDPTTFRNFRVMRDEFVAGALTRVTDGGLTRVTDSGLIRVTDGKTSAEVTHNYFVQPANNPDRISTWTTNKFDDDQTLRQLFR